MRIVSWNICNGGGSRSGHISKQLTDLSPDIVGLLEFRDTPPSQSILASLKNDGLIYQYSTIDPKHPTFNRLLIAARNPIELQATSVHPELGRWLHVSVEDPLNLHLFLLCVPNRDKTGIKYEFHKSVVKTLPLFAEIPALAFGDTNTGIPGIDEESPFFNKQEGEWFNKLERIGWIDLWRKRNPDRKQYTWHNYASGAGFRLDQVFGTNAILNHVHDVRYDWLAPPVDKFRGPSDHAALIIDLGNYD